MRSSNPLSRQKVLSAFTTYYHLQFPLVVWYHTIPQCVSFFFFGRDLPLALDEIAGLRVRPVVALYVLLMEYQGTILLFLQVFHCFYWLYHTTSTWKTAMLKSNVEAWMVRFSLCLCHHNGKACIWFVILHILQFLVLNKLSQQSSEW